MADELRIKGQEMQVRITKGGELKRTLTAVESLTFTVKVDILRKSYLGETTDRRDDIYRGVALELSIDSESPEVIELLEAIRDRASRRTSAAETQINVTFSMAFQQKRKRISIPDLHFQDPGLSVSGRDAYVPLKLTAEAVDFKVIA